MEDESRSGDGRRWTPSYATLLVALVLALVLLHPLSAAGFGRLSYPLTFAILAAAAVAASNRRSWRRATLLLLCVTLLAEGLAWARPERGPLIATRAANAAFLVFVTVVIVGDVVRRRRVTTDVVFGALCAYLLVGYSFYLGYCVLELALPGSFEAGGQPLDPRVGAAPGRFPILVYYSFVTLTTLGYGDVTPLQPLGRSIASFEAVFGQLYLAVLVARLVGTHLLHGGDRAE